MKKKRVIASILFHIVLLVAVLFILYPFVFMISGALKTDLEMNRHILRLIPREITLDNFKTLFAVSYTHLDVYKRQGKSWEPSDTVLRSAERRKAENEKKHSIDRNARCG